MQANVNRRLGWSRSGERRLGLSRLLAQGLEISRSSLPQHVQRTRLERDIAQLLDAHSVLIRESSEQFRVREVRERPGVVTVPLPDGTHGQGVLEVRSPVRELDGWARQSLTDIARIVALVLGAQSRPTIAETEEPARAPWSPTMVGRSPRMARLRHEISRMARTDFIVLIEGDSGSGKELVARLIHEESDRRAGPFIGVNCAALVETLLEAELFGIEDRTATGVKGRRGKFELASDGTLFLDEISDLSPAAQAKLLRAIQELSVERVGGHATRTINARIVVATNQSLRELVAQGRFRADLFYRLSGLEIQVPPLRARREDITALAAHFLQKHRGARDIEIAAPAMDALVAYAWPGNVRELERVVERAVTLASSSAITLQDLPPRITCDMREVLEPSLERDDTMRAWGSRYARIVLERCQHNKRRACCVLGISYHTLQAYLAYSGRRNKNAEAPANPRAGRASES